jgi:ribonuclease HI
MIQAYTDGSSLGNPGPWWWAFLVMDNSMRVRKESSGGVLHTTNNRMELSAVLHMLEYVVWVLQAVDPKKVDRFVIWSDSQYVRKWVLEYMSRWQRNWWMSSQKKPVLNQDLWIPLSEQIIRCTDLLSDWIVWEWVKGHADNSYNERVDYLARQAAMRMRS